jgi:hypothetical protein
MNYPTFKFETLEDVVREDKVLVLYIKNLLPIINKECQRICDFDDERCVKDVAVFGIGVLLLQFVFLFIHCVLFVMLKIGNLFHAVLMGQNLLHLTTIGGQVCIKHYIIMLKSYKNDTSCYVVVRCQNKHIAINGSSQLHLRDHIMKVVDVLVFVRILNTIKQLNQVLMN